ncbi:BamA/TamA family outer membrane protein [Mucilaginibacter glaciei]|uniref:Polymerase n=1 Tax=Mucilaginibacter glaciei TaxID=2772109 RepID=A0A926NPR9_9SPHI|nr:polymerase [Mucilaginibacter glaciei]MBD1392822.1 polymerase [Mucilaginibacter glaciei]
MKKLCLFALISALSLPTFAQRKILPKFLYDMYFSKDSTKKASFVLLPVLSTAPETGLEIGGSALYSFYTDTVSRNTRVSNIFAYGTITTKGQSRINLSSSYWAPQNKYHYTGSVGYINFPFDFYGVGNNTRKADADRLGQKRVRVTATAEKKLGNNIYVGLVGGGYDYRFDDQNTTGIFATDPTIEGRHGGTFLYIGPSLVFDSRNNNTYTTKGIHFTSYLNLMKGVNSNNGYSGGLFNAEYAQYFRVSKRFVLAVDIQEQSLTGSQSPFYLLPALGSDEMMRGYYNGRFRDRNLLAGQTELRYRLADRIGIVGFLGAGQVFNKKFDLSEFKPNYGGGLRYFFDTEKGLSIRVDYGVGEKRPGESRQSGVYIGLGEAF